MAHTTHSSPLTVAYARALQELAAEQHLDLESVGVELRDLKQLIEADPTFQTFLANPSIGSAERGLVLERTLAGQLSPLLFNTLKVLNEKNRLGLLVDLSPAYDLLLKQRLGKVDVDVTVAHRLSDEELEQVRQRVSQTLGKDVLVHQKVDESIIGGLILQVGDRLLDASVRSQLQALRSQILAGRPREGAALFGH